MANVNTSETTATQPPVVQHHGKYEDAVSYEALRVSQGKPAEPRWWEVLVGKFAAPLLIVSGWGERIVNIFRRKRG